MNGLRPCSRIGLSHRNFKQLMHLFPFKYKSRHIQGYLSTYEHTSTTTGEPNRARVCLHDLGPKALTEACIKLRALAHIENDCHGEPTDRVIPRRRICHQDRVTLDLVCQDRATRPTC